MEEERGEGAPYMFLLIAIIFMRLFLCGCFIFIFCVVLLMRGPSNWERGRMWWRRCVEVFFYFFIFYYFNFIGHFVVYACCLYGSVERREHFFLGTIMQAEVMQETCQEPKEAVVTEDGVSISITGRHHHQSNIDEKDKKETCRYKKAHAAIQQARSPE